MKFSHLFRKSLIAIGFVGMATTFGGQSATAATETDTLDVTAHVDPACLISTLPVAFGTYDPLGTNASNPLDGSGSVQITCANGLAVNVRLGQGATPAGGSTAAAPLRQMAGPNPGDVLAYNLHVAALPAGAIWGDTTATSVAAVGTGVAQSLTVFGRIPAGQNVQSGDYADTVLASVDF